MVPILILFIYLFIFLNSSQKNKSDVNVIEVTVLGCFFFFFLEFIFKLLANKEDFSLEVVHYVNVHVFTPREGVFSGPIRFDDITYSTSDQ